MISKLTCSVILISFVLSFPNLSSQTLHFDNLRLKESFQRVEFSIDSLSDSNNIKLTEKSPVLAGTLSFIVPGLALGQIYNGQTEKFFVHGAVSFGCIMGLAVSGGTLIEIRMDGGSRGAGLLLAIVAIYAGNWIWSTVDAVNSAKEINKQITFQKYRTDVPNKFKFGLTLDKNKNLNFKFAFEL